MTGGIDVMLPYYGDDDYLRAAVESVRSQAAQGWRLVLVDDRKPESSAAAWIASLGDPRIEHVTNPENLGVAKNFARCTELVEAEHFVIMGSDDIMLPNFIETVSAGVRRHPSSDVFQPRVQVINESGDTYLPLGDRIKAILRPSTKEGDVRLESEAMARSLVRADWAYFPSLLWRTERVKEIGFRTDIPIALDLALLLDIAMAGGDFIVLDDLSFSYRRHQASVSMASAKSGERFVEERHFFLVYAQKFAEIGWKRTARIARRHAISRLNALSEAPGAIRRGDRKSLRALLGHVFAR